MVLIAASLGLRASEIGDYSGVISTDRTRPFRYAEGVVNGRVGDTNTEASRKALPLGSALADALLELRRSQIPHTRPDDWFSVTDLVDLVVSRTSCGYRSNPPHYARA
jgi:hypothetical protein